MLTNEQKKQLLTKGYVIVKDLFSYDEIKPLINYANTVLDEVAKMLYKDGHISSLYEEYDYTKRLNLIHKEYNDAAVITTLQKKMGKPLFNFWNNKKYLNIAKQLLGGNIDGHPFWTLRSQVPNEQLLTVPWHQDAAYLKKDADPVFIFWTPLTNVDKNSGCMEIIPTKLVGREAKVYKHSVQNLHNSWYLQLTDNVDFEEIVTCEMNIGSVLIFNDSIIHRTLNNTSTNTRWSFDIRYMRQNNTTGTNQKSIPLLRKKSFNEEDKVTKNNFLENTVHEKPEPDYPTNFRKNMWWLDRWTKK